MELGLDLDYAPNGMSLLIRRVKDGKVREWNNANADQAVQDSDRIVEVNGRMAEETVAPLLKQLKQKGILEIVIARPMMKPTPPKLKDGAQEHEEDEEEEEEVEQEKAEISVAHRLAPERGEEEGRNEAEEEAQRRAEEETRKRAEEEAQKRNEEKARKRAEEEAQKTSEEEARKRADEEARKRAEEEAQRTADDEARKKAEEEELQRRNAEEEEARRPREEGVEVGADAANIANLAEVAHVSIDQAAAALRQTEGDLDEALVLLMSVKDS